MTLLGALTSVYYVGYFVGTFTLPPLIHRIGHIRAFAFCTALVAAWCCCRRSAALLVVAALGCFRDWHWSGLYAIIESWLNVAAQPEHRNSVFSVYMMLNLGALAVPSSSCASRPKAFVLFSVVAILISVAIMPVARPHGRCSRPCRSIPETECATL